MFCKKCGFKLKEEFDYNDIYLINKNDESYLDKINYKDTKSLRNYYNMALANRDIYGKMSYVSKMVYDRSLNLIQSSSQKNKSKVKSEERELNQVA